MLGNTQELHYSPQDLARLWGMSRDSIIRLFENEPGVVILENPNPHRRHYRTLRIPQSVADRVHRRISRFAIPA